MTRVLVVEDEENIRLVLQTLLAKHGYDVETSASAEQALSALERRSADFVLSDVRLPGMDGIALCEAIGERFADTTVIVMSAYGTVDLALSAVRAGAYDYIGKPFKQDEVLFALRKAEERQRLRRENAQLRSKVGSEADSELLGQSAAMAQVLRVLDKVAAYRTTVLIQGESGTGKELVARALHRRSPRAQRSFVAINCGAIPASLMESELFGHKRGSFTDAHSDRPGIFQEANQGTLFLDEIGEIEPALQVKLLRVLQEGCVRPVGGARDVPVDVRVVAATVRDLATEVREGRFREDLYYRLNVLQIRVPPLRERIEDILLLADHFVARNNARLGTAITGMDEALRKRMLAYHWPGNVRELENSIERAVVMAEGDTLRLSDLPQQLCAPVGAEAGAVRLEAADLSIKRATRELEITLIRQALARTEGNRTAAARLLELSHRALLYKIKAYKII